MGNSLKLWVFMSSILALAACESSHEPLCGAGDSYTLNGASYCFASSSLVIETGFECPAELPNGFKGPEGVICAPPGYEAKDLPMELCEKAGDSSCANLALVMAEPDASTMPDATIGESDGGRCLQPNNFYQWYEPGCEGDGTETYQIAEGGECLEGCASDSCGPGLRCATASALPACVKDGCDACGESVGVCVPDHRLDVSGTSNVDGDGIVVWSVSSGSPDYGYVYGRFTVAEGEFSLAFNNSPPPDALNTGKLGVGLLLVADPTTYDLQAIADGRANESDQDVLDVAFAGAAAGKSCDYAIVFTEGDPAFRDWVTRFDPGYSCAKVVPAAEGESFDTFEPVSCDQVNLERGCDPPNWT